MSHVWLRNSKGLQKALRNYISLQIPVFLIEVVAIHNRVWRAHTAPRQHGSYRRPEDKKGTAEEPRTSKGRAHRAETTQ